MRLNKKMEYIKQNIVFKIVKKQVLLNEENREFITQAMDSKFNWKIYGKKDNEIYLDNKNYTISKEEVLIVLVMRSFMLEYNIAAFTVAENLNCIQEAKFSYTNQKEDYWTNYKIAFIPALNQYYFSTTEIRLDHLGQKRERNYKSSLNEPEFQLWVKEVSKFIEFEESKKQKLIVEK